QDPSLLVFSHHPPPPRPPLFPYTTLFRSSFVRKAKEVILSLELTRRYSKDEILEFYLNEINYGNLSYGIEAAAETYFNKSARELDRKSTRLNSSHLVISYAVFCLKKKKKI